MWTCFQSPILHATFRFDCEDFLYQDGRAARATSSLQPLNVSCIRFPCIKANVLPKPRPPCNPLTTKEIYIYIYIYGRAAKVPPAIRPFNALLEIPCITAGVLPEPHPPCTFKHLLSQG